MSTKMPNKLDRALREWPAAGSAEDGEARIERVVARIEALGARQDEAATSTDDDELFASPLPRAAGEGEAPASVGTASSRERLAERRNLKELAKLAEDLDARAERAEREGAESHRAGDARGDDSGIIHLATATKSAPVLERARASSASTGAAAPAPAKEPPPPTAPSVATAPSVEAAPKPRRAMVLALYATTTVALASAAAAVFLFVQAREPASMTVASAPEPKTEQPTEAPPPAAPPTTTASPPGASALALGTDPNSLPPATAPGRPSGKTTPAAESQPARTEAAPAASLAARDVRATDLGSAIQREVGDDARGPRDTRDTRQKTPAAALTGGEVPQRPSQGAITGAIGSVLPNARRCLGPDDPVSHAAIVFASSGSVQSVAVTGPASGKPTESCVKDALSKAKVPPFAEPTSTANITIRHL